MSGLGAWAMLVAAVAAVAMLGLWLLVFRRRRSSWEEAEVSEDPWLLAWASECDDSSRWCGGGESGRRRSALIRRFFQAP